MVGKGVIDQCDIRAPISIGTAADLMGVSTRSIHLLAADGYIEKPFTPFSVARGWAKHKNEGDRRSTKTASKSRLDDIRAEEQAFKLAALKGEFVRTDAAVQVLDDVFGPLRAALNGVPAAASRDMPTRKKIETLIASALNEAANRAAERRDALGSGGNPASPATAALARRLGTGGKELSRRGRRPRTKRTESDAVRDSADT